MCSRLVTIPSRGFFARSSSASCLKPFFSSSSSSFSRPTSSLLYKSSFSSSSFAHPSATSVAESGAISTAFPSSPSLSCSSSSSSTTSPSTRTPLSTESLLAHKSTPSLNVGDDYLLPHPIWHNEYIDKVQVTHRECVDFVDKAAYWTIKTIRFNFDWMSGWSLFTPNERRALNRVVFLETIAAIPGSIGGILRHLSSLRKMKRDNGWIHTLFEEAENERMHLLTFVQMRSPGLFMRSLVFLSQGLFFNFFWIMYLVSPKFCHRLVGYLEEEAVKTYTKMIVDYDKGFYPSFKTMEVPAIAKKYWKMEENCTVRDLLMVIRADEAHHRDVNHTFGDLKKDQLNPFKPGN